MKIVGALATLVVVGAAPVAAASTIAVIDSGLDYKNQTLAPVIWHNPGDLANDPYANDTYGWNFADKNNEVIDYSLLNTFPDDDYKYFQLQSKELLGTATADEKQWLTDKQGDTTFMSGLETFANFIHGTHVSGIATASRSTERVLMLKIIETKTPTIPGMADLAARARASVADSGTDNPVVDMLVQYLLDYLVKAEMGVLDDAGKYTAVVKADVANGSFGTSGTQLKTAVKKLLSGLLGQAPTDDQVDRYVKSMIDAVNDKAKAMVSDSPNTLFVFAAGNDGVSNDDTPMAPANLGIDNTMSVAATNGFDALASFSNFGSTVDVAAPGVAINSTVPGDKFMQLSGTSMAAPFVTEAAAIVRDANPALAPADVKRLLIATVDVKPFLAGKVASSGIVNGTRAKSAAALMAQGLSFDQAVAKAKTAVADQIDATKGPKMLDDRQAFVMPLPSPLHF